MPVGKLQRPLGLGDEECAEQGGMGPLPLGWKRWALALGVVLTVLLLYNDRRGCYQSLGLLQNRLLVCTHHSDSLSSQLEGSLLHPSAGF